jgi:hypothetical protein
MAIQISGCTVIDNSRNITNANNMCVGVVTMTGSSGDIETPGTITAGAVDFPLELEAFFPANNATNVDLNSNISLIFNGVPTRGTGTIELRSGSTSGTILESFDAETSDRIIIAGTNWILDPTSDLLFDTQIFPVIPSTAIQDYVGLNTTGADSYSFTTRVPDLGESYEGGFLICKSSPTRWIVAPDGSEVSRTWHTRNDANTRAQSFSGCTGWFVPSCGNLQNPGFTCRDFWDSFSSTTYWSSTENNSTHGWSVSMVTGAAFAGPPKPPPGGSYNKSTTYCVRAFRCVTY